MSNRDGSRDLTPDLLAAVFESASDAIVVTDDDRRFVAVNRAACDLLGRPRAEILRLRLEDIAPAPDRHQIVAAFAQLLGSGTYGDLTEMTRPDGSLRILENSTRANVQPGRHVTILRDVTERVEAERRLARMTDELAASEARFRAAFEDNPEVIAVLRPVHAADGTFEDVEVSYLNGAARMHYLGTTGTEEELIGKRLFVLRPLMRPVLFDAYAEMARARMQLRGEIHGMTQAGEVWGSYMLFPLGDEFVHVGRDITAERRAAQVVAQNEERFRRTLETLLDPLIIARAIRDEAGVIVDFVLEFANSAASRYQIVQEGAVGRRLSELVTPTESRRFVELYTGVIETGAPLALDGIVAETGAGIEPATRVLDIRAHKLGESVVATWRDVSEQRALTEQVSRANRLESLGRLAAGVAHDFNNVLHGVGLMAELIAENAESADVIAEAQEIVAATERGRMMTRSLLAFAQGGSSERRAVNPGSLVRETVALLERVLGSSVLIEMCIPDDLPPILADEAGLGRALINLAVNARDAMPDGGTLTIELRATRLQGARADAAGVKPGRYVIVSVTDTGEGIKPELLDRIFEPFFTTKPAGVGTGLGLATTYGFVKSNGGGITVESEVGRGSTFRLHLPVA